MRFLAPLFILLPLLNHAQTTDWRTKTAPELLVAFDRDATCDLLVVLEEQADVTPARDIRGKAQKAAWVAEQLQNTAARTQNRALRILREHNAAANSLWVVNAIAVDKADRRLAEALAALPEVKRLSPDPWSQLDQLPQPEQPAATRSAIEWGVDRLNAPTVWAMGFTGQGITVGGADTGYDWLHPALKPKYRGYFAPTDTFDHDYNWHDGVSAPSPLNPDTLNPCGFSSPVPCDDDRHGTHTAGTMVGDDGMGNQIGVAPGARWIGCRNMERNWGRPSTYLNCFEWFLAPTDVAGNNADPAQAPHVINNSWYCASIEGCIDVGVNELLQLAVVNLKASGVFVVVSNGNFGSGCGTTEIPPAYFEESFSVGSIQINDTISGFSSRGPIAIDSSFRVKPNVAAPGSDVRSCVPGGGYDIFSGTSMAGPHVAGLVALVLSAAPELEGEVGILEDIIEQTARPRFDGGNCMDNNGTNLPNNTYGFGIVDALAAVQRAQQVVSTLEPNKQLAVWVAPNPARTRVEVRIAGATGPVEVQLFNVQGQPVYRQIFTAEPEIKCTVDVSHLISGPYFYRIRDARQTMHGVLVKN